MSEGCLLWHSRYCGRAVQRAVEVPKTLPMPMVRWGGTAWHRLGSYEPPCHPGGLKGRFSRSVAGSSRVSLLLAHWPVTRYAVTRDTKVYS